MIRVIATTTIPSRVRSPTKRDEKTAPIIPPPCIGALLVAKASTLFTVSTTTVCPFSIILKLLTSNVSLDKFFIYPECDNIKTAMIIIYNPISLTVKKLGNFLLIIINIPASPTKTNNTAHQVPTKNAANPLITSDTGLNGQHPMIAINNNNIPFISTK